MKRKFWAALLAITLAPALFAEGIPATEPQEPEPFLIDHAMVTLDGEPLFQVAGMRGSPAEKRAEVITGRLEKIASNSLVPTSAIAVENLSDRSNITADGTFIAMILDIDAPPSVPRAVIAERARVNIVQAIANFREERRPSVLMVDIVKALTATAALFIVLFVVSRVFRVIAHKTEIALATRLSASTLKTAKMIPPTSVHSLVSAIVNSFKFILNMGLVFFYFQFVLNLFPWTRSASNELLELVAGPFQSIAKSFVESIPDLIFLAVLFFVVRIILNATRVFFDGIGNGTIEFQNFERDWAMPTYRIARLLIFCFAAVVAYPYIPGSSSDAFKGVSLFVGVLFSLGSTSFIANSIAGLALTYRRAFRVGDVIKIDGITGIVTDMRLQATHMRTLKNEAVVVPNSEVVNSHIMNYSTLSQNPGLWLYTKVGISYSVPWRQVEALLMMAAEKTAGIKTDPAPRVRQLMLDTFTVQYEINVCTDAPVRAPEIYTNLHRNILDCFNEYGIQIMTPAYEGDPEAPKLVDKAQWFAAPAKKDA